MSRIAVLYVGRGSVDIVGEVQSWNSFYVPTYRKITDGQTDTSDCF